MEEYHTILSNRLQELYSITSKLSEKGLSNDALIKLREQYVVASSEYLKVLKILDDKIKYAKDKCEKQLAILKSNHT